MNMERIDRMALIVRPRQPYIDWANGSGDDGSMYDPLAIT